MSNVEHERGHKEGGEEDKARSKEEEGAVSGAPNIAAFRLAREERRAERNTHVLAAGVRQASAQVGVGCICNSQSHVYSARGQDQEAKGCAFACV